MALATRQADVEVAMAVSANNLSKPFERLKTTQQRLVVDTEAVALRGFIDPARIEHARNI